MIEASLWYFSHAKTSKLYHFWESVIQSDKIEAWFMPDSPQFPRFTSCAPRFTRWVLPIHLGSPFTNYALKIHPPLKKYTELSSPLEKTSKWLKLIRHLHWMLLAVNNRIQNHQRLKARDFQYQLVFIIFLLFPLTNKLSPDHWDRGVW